MTSRMLFLCARASSRSIMAASILSARAESHWEIWSTPTRDKHGLELAEQVLREQGIQLMPPDRLIQPIFGMHWDEGIVLCSGEADY